jgi:hypothetical protein
VFGISSSGKDNIIKIVEEMFDSISLSFIGDIPKLKNKKLLVISSERNFGLANLFVQAMQNKTPNPIEQDILKSILNSAHGYIESLKNKTASNIVERIDGLAREASLKNQKMDEDEVQAILNEEMKRTSSNLQSLVESESTKFRNLGNAMEISRVASSLEDMDPTVFFVVVRDNKLCSECRRLHLMPDGVTPRLWKLSELKQGYGKRGDETPSLFNRHPNCRCTLTYLSSGFSFDKKGKIAYRSENFNALEWQRKNSYSSGSHS